MSEEIDDFDYGGDFKKRKLNSRSKGVRGERQLAKLLTAWVGTNFARTPGSGAHGHWGVTAKLVGDIIPEDGSQFPFVVECKHWAKGATYTKKGLPSSVLRNAFFQVIRDSEAVQKTPLLFVRETGARHWLLFYPATGGSLHVHDYSWQELKNPFKIPYTEWLKTLTL